MMRRYLAVLIQSIPEAQEMLASQRSGVIGGTSSAVISLPS